MSSRNYWKMKGVVDDHNDHHRPTTITTTTTATRNYHYNPDGSRGVPRSIKVVVTNHNKRKDGESRTAAKAKKSSVSSKLEDSLSGETLATFTESFSTFGDNNAGSAAEIHYSLQQQQRSVSDSTTTTLSDRDDCLYNNNLQHNPLLPQIPKEEKQLELQKLLCQQDTILCNQMDSSNKYLDKCLSKMIETISTNTTTNKDEDWSTFKAFCNDYHPSNDHNNNNSRRTRTKKQSYIYDPYNKTKIYLERNHLSFWTITQQSLADAKKSKLFLPFKQNDDGSHHQSSITTTATDLVEVRGCFDHFHQGHQQLLQGALLVATKFLLVTIISKPQNKQYMNSYQPLHQREETVRSYLQQQQHANNDDSSLLVAAPKIFVVNDQIRNRDLAHLDVDVGVYGSEYYGCSQLLHYGAKKILFVSGNCSSLSTQLRKQQEEDKKKKK